MTKSIPARNSRISSIMVSNSFEKQRNKIIKNQLEEEYTKIKKVDGHQKLKGKLL